MVAVLLEDVVCVGLCLGCGGIDAVGLMPVEEPHGLAYLREDGGSVDGGLDGAVVVGQGCHLVLIVTCRCSHLPAEVLQGEQLGIDADVEAHVLQTAVVAPVLVET